MRFVVAVFAVLIPLFFFANTVQAQTSSKPARVYQPTVGSSERKAILDALRIPVEKNAKQAVVFHNVRMFVCAGWVYVEAVGRDKQGAPLKRAASSGVPPEVELVYQCLLRKEDGKWKTLRSGAGSDTAPLREIIKEFPQAPVGIFPVRI